MGRRVQALFESNRICERVRCERLAAGISQAQAAKAVGVTTNVWSKWERSDQRIDADLIPAIAKALGVTCARLYGEQPKVLRETANIA